MKDRSSRKDRVYTFESLDELRGIIKALPTDSDGYLHVKPENLLSMLAWMNMKPLQTEPAKSTETK